MHLIIFPRTRFIHSNHNQIKFLMHYYYISVIYLRFTNYCNGQNCEYIWKKVYLLSLYLMKSFITLSFKKWAIRQNTAINRNLASKVYTVAAFNELSWMSAYWPSFHRGFNPDQNVRTNQLTTIEYSPIRIERGECNKKPKLTRNTRQFINSKNSETLCTSSSSVTQNCFLFVRNYSFKRWNTLLNKIGFFSFEAKIVETIRDTKKFPEWNLVLMVSRVF